MFEVKPVEFKGQNCVFVKDQTEPLPAMRMEGGQVVSCWSLTWTERFWVLLSGRLWLSVFTFDQALQPLQLTADRPFLEERDPVDSVER